jgi:hypothetical protein
MIVNLDELKKPFSADDIEWRVQRSGLKDGKPWAMVLAYVTNRAIQDRLDDVCGPENWKNEFVPAPDGGVLCGISILVGDKWVTKWDGAPNTNFEAVKGGLSGAMKRAAVQWGIGRYLYRLEATFANIAPDGIYRDKVDDNGKPIWFRWNPPVLPKWALPTESATKPKKELTKEEQDTKMKAMPDSVKEYLRGIGATRSDIIGFGEENKWNPELMAADAERRRKLAEATS